MSIEPDELPDGNTGRTLHLFAIVTIVVVVSVFILYAWLPVG